MDHQQFNGNMDRLAAAYRIEVPAQTRAVYWTLFGAGDDARFGAACDRALRTEKAFPTPAALTAHLNGAAEVHRRTTADAVPTRTLHRWTAADFDVPFVAKSTPWRPGSRAHERWLHASARLTTLLERRLAERLEELDRGEGFACVENPLPCDATASTCKGFSNRSSGTRQTLPHNPNDADRERRVQVLVRTLGERSTWHAHFEQTGESLIPGGAP